MTGNDALKSVRRTILCALCCRGFSFALGRLERTATAKDYVSRRKVKNKVGLKKCASVCVYTRDATTKRK